jgi:cell shape-determining protein MreC
VSPSRVRFLLAVLLVGQLFLIAAQEPDLGGASNLLEGAALRSLGPFARAVDASSQGIATAREGLRRRDDLAAENRLLREELLELRRRELRMAGLEQEIEGLAKTLAFQRRHSATLRIAEVVHVDYRSWLRSLVLYVGTGAAQPAGALGRRPRRAGDSRFGRLRQSPAAH